MENRKLKGGTAKMVFFAVVIIILLIIAYYVYQTYVWLGKFGGLVDGEVPDDTGELKDMMNQLNEFIQNFLKQLKGG
jgi:hypothetical protein